MRLFILACEYLNDDQLGYLSCIFNSPQIQVVGVAVYQANIRMKSSIAAKIKRIAERLQKSGIRNAVKYVNIRIYYQFEGTFHDPVKVSAGYYFKEKKVPVLFTSQRYSDEVIEFIKSKKPDAMFAMDFGLIKEPLLSLTPKGIISYHHGDFRKYRGIPACFWPMYNAETEMKVTIQILDKGIDCGPIIKEKNIPIYKTDTLKLLNRRAYTQTYSMAADACRLLDNDQFIPQKLPKEELGPVYTAPTLVQWINFIIRVNFRRLSWFLIKNKADEEEVEQFK